MVYDSVAARAVASACSAANVVIVSRAAGPDTYGRFASAMIFSSLLLTVIDLGVSAVFVREGVYSNEREAAARTYIQARLLLSMGAIAAGAAITQIAFPAGARTAALASLVTVIFCGAALIAPIAQLHGSMRTFRNAASLQGVLSVGTTIAVVSLSGHPSALHLVVASAVASVTASTVALWWARKWLPAELAAIDWGQLRGMLKATTWMAAGSIAAVAYARIDGLMLLNLGSSHDTGVYQAAYRFLDESALIPSAIMIPISPLLVAELKQHGRVSRAVDRVLVQLEVAGGTAVAWLTIGSSYWLAAVLLGRGFDGAASLVAILAVYRAWSLVAIFATLKTVHTRRERSFALIACVGLLINISANIYAIPRFGAQGAAVVTVLTEICTVVAFVHVSRRVSSAPRLGSLLKCAISGTVAAALILGSSAVWDGATPYISALVVSVGGLALWRTSRLLRTDLEAARPSVGAAPDLGR